MEIERRKMQRDSWCRGCGADILRHAEAITGRRRLHGGQVALIVCLPCGKEIGDLATTPVDTDLESNNG